MRSKLADSKHYGSPERHYASTFKLTNPLASPEMRRNKNKSIDLNNDLLESDRSKHNKSQKSL